MHEWNGQEVRLRSTSLVSASALHANAGLGFAYHAERDLKKALTSRRNMPPTFAWILHEFVRSRGPEYKRWKQAMEAGRGLEEAYAEAGFGNAVEINKQFFQWLSAWLATLPILHATGDWMRTNNGTFVSM